MSLFIIQYSLFIAPSAYAAVSRGRINSAVSRAPVAAKTKAALPVSVPEAVEEPSVVVAQAAAPVVEVSVPVDVYAGIDSKADEFALRFGVKPGTSGDKNDCNSPDKTPLQKNICEQRKKLNMESATEEQAITIASRSARMGNNMAEVCDNDLRNCMAEKCGDMQFSKCANDADVDWGHKIDSCRRNTKCTGTEFAALSVEIKADRDQARVLSGFGGVIKCGTRYNNCIRDICGNNQYTACIGRGNPAATCAKNFASIYEKCWAKAGGDKAVAACDVEFKKCEASDSGLRSRAMELFSGLRVMSEKNIVKWEKELYDMKDSMANMCKMSLGILDERAMNCVYTVELFADDDGKSTQFASKKIAGGDNYMCVPEWFGVDITTFMENAFRATRSATSASSAVMGMGAGMVVGGITSGAFGRAIERQQSEKELCETQNGKWNSFLNKCEEPKPAVPVEEPTVVEDDEMQIAPQTCVEQGMLDIDNNGVCEDRIECDNMKEIYDAGTNTCNCNASNGYSGTAGSCVCNLDGFKEVDGVCQPEKQCTGQNQIYVAEKNDCEECGANEKKQGNTCVCDTSKGFVGMAGKCENCWTANKIVENNACVVCGLNEAMENNQCVCKNPNVSVGGTCQKPISCVAPSVPRKDNLGCDCPELNKTNVMINGICQKKIECESKTQTYFQNTNTCGCKSDQVEDGGNCWQKGPCGQTLDSSVEWINDWCTGQMRGGGFKGTVDADKFMSGEINYEGYNRANTGGQYGSRCTNAGPNKDFDCIGSQRSKPNPAYIKN